MCGFYLAVAVRAERGSEDVSRVVSPGETPGAAVEEEKEKDNESWVVFMAFCSTAENGKGFSGR